jgi:putative PIN family toxin of toxin-antitoxin system
MRIVLDTNLVMSALLWRGTPYRLLDAIRQRSNTQLYSSATLLEELADVLTRPSATKRLALIEKTAAMALADYIEIIELVTPTTVPRVVPGDIDDDLTSFGRRAIARCVICAPYQASPTTESG